MRSPLAGLLDLLFPPRCAGCGRAGHWLCPACLAQVEWITPPICPLCGEAAPSAAQCPRRGHHPQALAGLRSAVWHVGPIRSAIHRFKYRGQHVLAEPLGAIIVEAWRRDPPPAGLLVPVPLHPRRARERGYNQAALLARQLGRALALPVDSAHLVRIRATPPQVGLTASERLANVAGAFRYRGPSLAGRTLCLIDDLCTTGATLEACASALREAGAGSVWAYTLARPRWEAAFAPRKARREERW